MQDLNTLNLGNAPFAQSSPAPRNTTIQPEPSQGSEPNDGPPSPTKSAFDDGEGAFSETRETRDDIFFMRKLLEQQVQFNQMMMHNLGGSGEGSTNIGHLPPFNGRPNENVTTWLFQIKEIFQAK